MSHASALRPSPHPLAPLPGAMAKDEDHLGTATESPPCRGSYKAWRKASHASAPWPSHPMGMSQEPWVAASHASALRS